MARRQALTDCHNEFYQRFWDQLGPELTAVLSEAFQAGAASLPADMTEGRVTLLHKGKGADRAQPASYRPITLLNTDYKLAARVIASRLGPLLNHVVDSTQTGFLPQRWIGDNILAHLETIDFHQHSQQPGVLLFLDFEKAFDRLDRPWMERCMAAVGFGAGAQRWVSLLHAGTTARVAFKRLAHSTLPSPVGGLPGQPFVAPTVRSGGPAHGRARTPVGRAAGTACPQHALGSASALHALPCRRHHHSCSLTGRRSSHTGGQHQPPLSGGLEPGCRQPSPPAWAFGCLQHLTGPDADTGITFSAAGSAITHLASHSAQTRTLRPAHSTQPSCQRLDRRIARWSGFRLSLLGRAHVAKQVLVSMFTYHGTFVPVPADILRQLCTSVYTFVAANRPAAAGAAHLFPSRAISARTLQQGGIALVDIPAQLTALQAKIIGRLLEPERVPWKAYFSGWLAMPLTAEQEGCSPSTVSALVAAGHRAALLQLP